MHGLGDHPTSPKLFACFLLLARAFVCGGDLLAMFNRGGSCCYFHCEIVRVVFFSSSVVVSYFFSINMCWGFFARGHFEKMKQGLDIKEHVGCSDSYSEEFDPYDIFFLKWSLEQRNGLIDFDRYSLCPLKEIRVVLGLTANTKEGTK